MSEEFGNCISGDWVPARSGETYRILNPADTRELVGIFPESTPEDAMAAVASAAEAQRHWRDVNPIRRGRVLAVAAEILRARADDIGAELTREEGKTVVEGRGEIHRAADVFEYFAGQGARLAGEVLPSARPGSHLVSVHQPVGVVVAITPFNFPAFIPSFKIGAALIAGNAVVWKPAEQTPLTGVRMVEALMEAGLPPGVLNYVTGNGAVLGPALLNAADVSAVTFTGSTRVGLLLARAAAERHIRIQHEMGGKNPLVVLADCDLEEAVAIAADGAFGGTGQKCTATSRIFVEQAVYDDFVSALADRAGALRVGNGLDTETDLGPLVSAAALEKVTDYIDIGVDEGAKLIGGTVRPNANGHSHGHFVAPAIFVDVHPGMRIMREEIFGPVVGVMPVSGYEEAAALCNDTDYGLSASIVTRDLEAAQRFTDDVEAGVLNINLPTTGVEYQAPFGGLKNSGSAFKECGSTGVDFFLVQKTVAVRPAIPSRRPPAESAPTTGAGV